MEFRLTDGRVASSEPATARGEPDHPLDPGELRSKYRTLARPVVGAQATAEIEAAVAALGTPAGDDERLLRAVTSR